MTEIEINYSFSFLQIFTLRISGLDMQFHGNLIESVWRHVTVVALFLDTAKRTAKNNMVILTNNNFSRASRCFVQLFAVVAPLRHETFLISWDSFMELARTQHKSYRFLFLNLR